MFRFVVRRLLQTIPVLFVIVTAKFFMVRFGPGGPTPGLQTEAPRLVSAA